MNELLSLYYYELKKNKTKFLIMLLFAILFLLICSFTIFFNNGDNMSVLEAKKAINIILADKNISPNLVHEVKLDTIRGISLTGSFFFISTLLKIIGAVIAVLMSFGVSINSFKKKNKSFYIYSCLPVKIWKIKLARILCGMSIYLFYLISISLDLLLIDLFLRLSLGQYYAASTDLFSPELVFIPTDPKAALFITFFFIPVCIAGIQFISSLFFVQKENKRNVVKKIFSIAALFVCGIFMISLIVYMQIYKLFILDFAIEAKRNLLFSLNPYIIGIVAFPIMFLILFSIDVRLSRKKFRGGV